MNISFAKIHAHVSGDGYTYISTAKRSKTDLEKHKRKNLFRKIYHIRYSNNDESLKRSFIEDVKSAFNRKAFLLSNGEVEVQGKWIFDKLRDVGALVHMIGLYLKTYLKVLKKQRLHG